MMRSLIVLVFFISWISSLFGQRDALLKVDTDTLQIELIATNGRLDISWKELLPTNVQAKKEFVSVSMVKLEDADLTILYQLPKPDKELYYRVKVNLRSINNDSITPSANRVLRDYGIVEQNFEDEKRIIWTDLTEDILYYGGTYRIYLTAELWGEVDCVAIRPSFELSKQWPHYAIAGVGLTMLGAGQLYRQQKETVYQDYQSFWLQGKSKDDADPLFNNSQKLYTTSRTLTQAGWALLGANAAWAAYRFIKVRKAQSLYDRHCGKEEVTWRVVPEIPIPGQGIKLGLIAQW